MALSIIEFGVYGFVCYASLSMLIISSIKEVPSGRSQSIVRAMFLIPGIFCAFLLASFGTVIEYPDQTVTLNEKLETALYNNSSGSLEYFTENRTATNTISPDTTLINPIWVTMHFLIGIVLLVYVVLQMLILFTKV